MTKIEWTEATWNPILGCDIVSPGCTNCYAMRTAHRLGQNPNVPRYAGLTRMTRGGPVWTGEMRTAPRETLLAPLSRKTPTTYFVNSMSDLFAENVPDAWIDEVFAIMALCPQHRFQVLTKRSARMRSYMAHLNAHGETRHEVIERKARFCIEDADAWITESWPLPNVWLGVSVEDQTRAEERIPDLLSTPAAVRFVSAEPLLGPLKLVRVSSMRYPRAEILNTLTGQLSGITREPAGTTRAIDWVICGGESGPDARPMHPDWARSLRDQCSGAGVPFFFKQWGEWGPDERPQDFGDPIFEGRTPCAVRADGRWHHYASGFDVPEEQVSLKETGEWVYRLGKKRTGRTLDGREWNEMPGET